MQDRHNAKTATGGGRFPTIFLKDKIPEGVEFFKVLEGQQIIDIIPWEVGPDMPLNEKGKPVMKKGGLDYILDIWVHQNVGKMKKPFICPHANFDLPCPICEFIKENRLDKEEWGKISPKRRSIYLIWDRKSPKTEKKGIQIFDASYFNMEEKLAEVATLPRGGGRIPFSHWDKGKHVSWKRKGTGQTNTRYIGHKLVDRESGIPDKILSKGFALDQVVHMHPSYEEIEKEFFGTKKKKDVKGSKLKDGKKKKKTREDIDDSKFDSGKDRKHTTDRKSSSDKEGKKKKKSSDTESGKSKVEKKKKKKRSRL